MKQFTLDLDGFRIMFMQSVHMMHTLDIMVSNPGLSNCCIKSAWIDTTMHASQQGIVKGYLASQANTNELIGMEVLNIAGPMIAGLINEVTLKYTEYLRPLLKDESKQDFERMNIAIRKAFKEMDNDIEIQLININICLP